MLEFARLACLMNSTKFGYEVTNAQCCSKLSRIYTSKMNTRNIYVGYFPTTTKLLQVSTLSSALPSYRFDANFMCTTSFLFLSA